MFGSFQRFSMGSIAVWAAVTHQGTDLYVVTAFAAFGFFICMLAYTQYITGMCFKQSCNKRMRVVSICVWVGIGVSFLQASSCWSRSTGISVA